ncbi:response regulator [Devosia sp. RR2S18]|uniref:response regulator n=1 Tax=Devosia rhizosphaerae TaxID=3049774 RepID=UPI00253FBAF6|nr:response regulator [Devosia sp. RR2S18]WIJ25891.1 response regulator [Devosia sp. RR2S18]
MPEILVLLVEDEAMLTLVLEEALKEGGYKVQVAHDGVKAIAVLEADPHRFHALVTDIRMPGKLTGWDVAHRARELVPTIPVVYMSGDKAVEWSAHGVPNSVMLQKPFAVDQAVTAVSQLLNTIPPTDK